MAIIIVNYVALLHSMALPLVAFYLAEPGSWMTSIAALLSLAMLLLVLVLFRWAGAQARDPDFETHKTNQKRILLLFAIAGLLGSLDLLLFYEQFRLRIDIDTPLRIALGGIWLVALSLIVTGLSTTLHRLWRPSAGGPAGDGGPNWV